MAWRLTQKDVLQIGAMKVKKNTKQKYLYKYVNTNRYY